MNFLKYHGLGNDFVVVDRRSTGEDVETATVLELCDRRRGIGADGVLAVLPSSRGAARMVVHNADGSVAEMCGNGVRCVARFLVERGGVSPDRLRIETQARVVECQLQFEDASVSKVTVAMGAAALTAPHLPSANGQPFIDRPVGGVRGTAISMGNPHLVLLDNPPSEAPQRGAELERNTLFPERTNVEFCRVNNPRSVDVTVWERGVGITQACGSGACAAVVAGALAGRVHFDTWVDVNLPGGTLEVQVKKDLSEVLLRGPATFVYEGQWAPPLSSAAVPAGPAAPGAPRTLPR